MHLKAARYEDDVDTLLEDLPVLRNEYWIMIEK